MGSQGTAPLSFGATPAGEASVLVSGELVAADSHIEAFFMQDSTADNTVDDHRMAALMISLSCVVTVVGDEFRIDAESRGWLATGDFKVRWVWN